jgi:hypothetical protein
MEEIGRLSCFFVTLAVPAPRLALSDVIGEVENELERWLVPVYGVVNIDIGL